MTEAARAMADAVLEIDLAVPLGDRALRVSARCGATTGVVGPSGAGKTSLLRALAGLRRAAGRVVVAGEVLQDSATGRWLAPERRRLGWVPQEGALLPHLDVRSNLLFGWRPAAAAPSLEEVAADLELTPLLDRHPRHLSGGERRRVALGRALLAAPRLLLLDEPTAGLDAARARRALGHLLRMLARYPVPVLVVTHRQEEALALAADLVVLGEDGQVAAGAAGDLLLAGALLEPGGGGRTENVRRGVVESLAAERGVATLRLGDGAALRVPWHPELRVGGEAVVAVAAEEVAVAPAAVPQLSTRNAFAVEVEAVRPLPGGSHLVRAGGWFAHLTSEAASELAVAPGRPLWLLIKSHSLRLVAA